MLKLTDSEQVKGFISIIISSVLVSKSNLKHNMDKTELNETEIRPKNKIPFSCWTHFTPQGYA
jgi:hypothetical protein